MRKQEFTLRQKRVRKLIAEGLSQKQIAERMGMTPNAVGTLLVALGLKTGTKHGVDGVAV